jgi:transposase
VERGNINDNVHFRRTFGLIRGFLAPGAEITFDAGANGKVNTDMLKDMGFRFLTRVEINESDEKKLQMPENKWIVLEDGTMACRFKGNLGYNRTVYFSEKRKGETLTGYRRKAERDYETMLDMKKAMDLGHEPRKCYRNSNIFVSTDLKIRPEYLGLSREDAIEEAVRKRITGREGYFILLSNWDESEQKALNRYRHRNLSEYLYRDLKTGIRIRPIRVKNWDAARGRVIIAYLALFVICFARFMVPELRKRTAETIVQDLRLFSLTRIFDESGKSTLHYSNYSTIIRHIDKVFYTFPLYKRRNRDAFPAFGPD